MAQKAVDIDGLPLQKAKELVLNTIAKQVVFDSLLAGQDIKTAAKNADITYNYAAQLASRYHINDLVKREQTQLSKQVCKEFKITVARQLREYDKLRKLAKRNKDYSTARGCLDSQSRIIGAFEADNRQSQPTFSLVLGSPEVKRKVIDNKQLKDCKE